MGDEERLLLRPRAARGGRPRGVRPRRGRGPQVGVLKPGRVPLGAGEGALVRPGLRDAGEAGGVPDAVADRLLRVRAGPGGGGVRDAPLQAAGFPGRGGHVPPGLLSGLAGVDGREVRGGPEV